MGSVRRDSRRSGWQARYRDRSGRQRTRTFAAKADAQRFMASAEADLARGTWTDPALAKVRFATYSARWRKSVAHLRPATLVNLDSRLSRHVLPAFGRWPIGNIDPADVRAWVSQLVESKLAPSTVVAIYRVLARIMATAEVDGMIPRTPCRGIKLPSQTGRTEMCFLSAAEVSRLADAIDPRYRTLIFTAAYTGMRWGELAGLRTERVDLLRASVQVSEALTEVYGHLAVGPTKTGKRRAVSMPRFLSDMLSNHIIDYPSTDGYVFTSRKGGPLRRSFYPRDFKPAVFRAGLPRELRFHDLRHTCAALLIAQGAHPKEIQERLGHSTIQLTFDRYGHLLPSLDNRLRDGLDEAYRAAQVDAGRGGEVIELRR